MKLVKVSFPGKDKNTINSSISRIKDKNMNIYNVVDFFEKNLFPKLINKPVTKQTKLKEIINLHNSDGIRKPSQIKSMHKQIKSKKEVLMPSKLPNIKLVKTRNEFVLFDGHHSLLAYMATGKKYLSEIPHLVVENENGCVTNKEIIVFFGHHSKKLRGRDWRNYVINWQAPEEKQLCKRIQKNMGELLDSLHLFS